jgi:hypothetical protein
MRKRVSEIESGAGYFAGLVSGLMELTREKSVPFEAIYRLVTPQGRKTLKKMVDLAHEDWLKGQSVICLVENEYFVPVSYAPFPSFSELEQEFGNGNVSIIFDGRPFNKHASCVNIAETPGYEIFLVKHFNREIKSEDAIVEMDKFGYRPATHIEAYEFQKKNPDLQSQFLLIALGSFAMDCGGRCLAALHSISARRIFGSYWFDRRWLADCRFLFVRK